MIDKKTVVGIIIALVGIMLMIGATLRIMGLF